MKRFFAICLSAILATSSFIFTGCDEFLLDDLPTDGVVLTRDVASWEVPAAEGVPVVYKTTDMTPDGLMAVFTALGVTPHGNVGVKVHTGETQYTMHLRPEFLADFMSHVDGTFVETNVAYGGRRASTLYHRQLAEEHGFTAIAPVDILDAYGYIIIPVMEGSHLPDLMIGEHLPNYDFIINIANFTGHALAGFGASIKNMSLGLASREGKSQIHSGGVYREGFSPHTWDNDIFLESAIEGALAITDFFGAENFIHINVIKNVPLDCDCMVRQPETGVHIHNIAILASLCPVALDQAAVDLVYAAEEGERVVVQQLLHRNGERKLEHAYEIGLGSRHYTLVSVD